MFLDNLSTSVLKLCDTQKLSYEAASERCDLSSGTLATLPKRTEPTIPTLEKLCVGFELTPDNLLIPSEVLERDGLSANQCQLHTSAAFDTSLA